jgi:soluble cytochrome b562
MLQNSKKVVNSMDKHQKIIADCEEALNELSPSSPAENKAMQDLQSQVSELQKGMQALLEKLNKENTN